MTVILGVKESGSVIIGGDSASVGWNYSKGHRLDKKVFSVGEFIFGCTTSWRMIQLLQFMFTPPDPHKSRSGLSYMVCQFIPAVKKLFKANGFEKLENNVGEGGNFLVGWRGGLYQVYSDYQVAEEVDIAACGCGEQYILGAARALAWKTRLGVTGVVRALEVCAKHSAGVYAPYYVQVLRKGVAKESVFESGG